jgi:hypothetical protein
MGGRWSWTPRGTLDRPGGHRASEDGGEKSVGVDFGR